MERSGNECAVKISGAATTMTAEATTTADNISYQITNAVKRVLDRDTAPTVLDGGVETTEDYTVNYLNGTITFESEDTRVITVTGKYLPMTTAAYAHATTHSKMCDMADVTAFGDTYKNRMATIKSASGTLSQFNVEDETYSDALVAGVPIVLEILSATGDEPDRYWALLESDEVQAAIDGVQDEVIGWVSYDYWLRLGV
jgi:hypothetical protein